MKFCTSCGSQLSEKQTFCTECGVKQETTQPVESKPSATSFEQETPQQEVPVSAPRKPMAKRTKILIGTAAGLLLVLFGTHLFLSSYFDPIKDLQAMDNAVTSNDRDEFMSHITFDDAAVLDEESYFAYIKDNEWDLTREKYLELLEKQQENPSPLDQSLSSVTGEKLFTVKKKPLVFGIYTTYSLEANPTKLSVSASMDDTEITVGEESQTLKADAPEEFLIYPGTYAVLGHAQNEFGEFTYEDTLDIGAKEVHELPITFADNTYAFSTNIPDATLFVNGEDTELRLMELDRIGPVPEDSEMELHAEWTSSEGETYTAEGQNGWGGLTFNFDETEIYQEETQSEAEVASTETEEESESETKTDSGDAGEIVLDFRDAYENAVNNKDFSQIDSFLQDDSTADSELSEYIGDLEDTDYHYDFTSNEVLDVSEDGNEIEVTTNELFTFTNHLNDVTEYDREKVYTLVSEDGSYKITNIEYLETNRDRQ
ncbi:TcaA NTF2-like domain-containing protein [Virgibacillus ainsalahensis]